MILFFLFIKHRGSSEPPGNPGANLSVATSRIDVQAQPGFVLARVTGWACRDIRRQPDNEESEAFRICPACSGVIKYLCTSKEVILNVHNMSTEWANIMSAKCLQISAWQRGN